MLVGYTETPCNMAEIQNDVIIETDLIAARIFGASKCWFYDACSFRKHANLADCDAAYILKYFLDQNAVVVITRCILMELASHSGRLNQEYVEYIKRIRQYGVTVLVLYEEDIFVIMGMCFGTNAVINRYLCWAVRMIKSAVSTITETLENNVTLCNEVLKGKNSDRSDIYSRFFTEVRRKKESGDNLGEELIAICLYILSQLPGEENGKFCVITEDKGAAGRINTMFAKINQQHRGKEIGIFSTPKLVQVLHRENRLGSKETIKTILGAQTSGNIVVLGIRPIDIQGRDFSFCTEELADWIMKPNGLTVLF